MGGQAGLGLPDLGSLGVAGGILDPGTVQQMLQNPHIQQMMQNLLSNLEYMSQVQRWFLTPPEFACFLIWS